jgi:hypothetical protein
MYVSPDTAGPCDWDRLLKVPASMAQSDALKKKGITSSLKPSFALYDDFFLGHKLITSSSIHPNSGEPARRMSYYTPNFSVNDCLNLQLGVSYTPDSMNSGALSVSDSIIENNAQEIFVNTNHSFSIDHSIKDIVSGGANLTYNISDGVDFKIGFTGEYGKAAGKAIETKGTVKTQHNLSNLRTYSTGALLHVGNFGFGLSYGSLGKSLTTKAYHRAGNMTDYYVSAVNYKYGPFNTSLSLFKANQFKNLTDIFTLATSVTLAPGLVPYVEVSQIKLNGRPEYFVDLARKKTKSTVALIGAKLHF